jgi:short-subunit dehydrogenase
VRPTRRAQCRDCCVGIDRGDAVLRCGRGLIRTNLFGPVRLTQELLPSMRAAGRGRIVVISSQGGIRGMPSISAYSASKGALERWAEALAEEIAPFGMGSPSWCPEPSRRTSSPSRPSSTGPQRAVRRAQRRDPSHGGIAVRLAARPERFAKALARFIDERAPFARHAVGVDAHLLMFASRSCRADSSIISCVWRCTSRVMAPFGTPPIASCRRQLPV